MEKRQLPFLFEDKQVTQNLLEEVSLVIKDSDAVAEKEMVKKFLQRVSDTISFVVIGDSKSGKTSFLDALFQGNLLNGQDVISTAGIHEIRRGAESITFQVDRNYIKSFYTDEQLEGLAVIDTQGIDAFSDEYTSSKLKECISKSDVLFAVFPADHIGSFGVWDYLEEVESRKIVFIMTKCDLVEDSLITHNEIKLKQYMSEAGIQAPVFKVSAKLQKEEKIEESGFTELQNYIREKVIGVNPVLTKQQENLKELKSVLSDLSQSFELRKKQYEADERILQNINKSMDSFIENNKDIIDALKDNLTVSINQSIDEYEKEIISRLDPYKIKELHKNGRIDFSEYLTFISDNYRQRMTHNVNEMTQQAVCAYLGKLEEVFEEASGYFRKRENLIKLEDRFYGTMAEGKKTALEKTERKLVATQNYYTSLFDASEELFMKIWNARDAYDREVEIISAGGAATGAAIGGVAAFAMGKTTASLLLAHSATVSAAATTTEAIAMAAKTAQVASTLATTLTTFWPIVGALISAVVIYKIAKKIAQSVAGEDLEKVCKEAIKEFKEEISKTRSEMLANILKTIDEIFNRELALVDKSFSEYRMSVNIDGKNIPVLEQRMEKVQSMLIQLEKIEERLLE